MRSNLVTQQSYMNEQARSRFITKTYLNSWRSRSL